MNLIATAPSVIYHYYLTDGSEVIEIDNPAMMPTPQVINYIEEPYVKASIMTPGEFVGLSWNYVNKRGEYIDIEYIDDTRRNVIYEIPLSEIVYDFFDKLKSSTKGYASLDYELIGYRESKLQKMDILLNGEVVDALINCS